MKTKSLLVAIAMLLLACQPKKESLIENKISSAISDYSSESTPACASPPVLETVKFVPPNIHDDAAEETSKPSATNNGLTTKNKKIIKDGSIAIKVKHVENAKKYMDAIVKAHHGYYENESFENNYSSLSYNLKVRVPSKQFDSFLKASENGEGEITSKNINARDVFIGDFSFTIFTSF